MKSMNINICDNVDKKCLSCVRSNIETKSVERSVDHNTMIQLDVLDRAKDHLLEELRMYYENFL